MSDRYEPAPKCWIRRQHFVKRPNSERYVSGAEECNRLAEQIDRAEARLRRIAEYVSDWSKIGGAPFRAKYYADELRAILESEDE